MSEIKHKGELKKQGKETQSLDLQSKEVTPALKEQEVKKDPILLLNSFNELVRNTTEILDKVSNIMELRAQIEQMRAQAAVLIKALELRHAEFLERERNSREFINQLLNHLDKLQQRILDKALAINISTCSEHEYNFLMTVLDQIQQFTFKLMDTIDKYVGGK